MNKKWTHGLVLIILVFAAGYFIIMMQKGSMVVSPSSKNQQNNSFTSIKKVMSPALSPISGKQSRREVTVSGNEFAFSPSVITIKRGQPVRLTFKNIGAYPHNFSLRDLNIQTKTIQPGQEDTIEFTVEKTGQYKYICMVDSHADKGMTGILNVE